MSVLKTQLAGVAPRPSRLLLTGLAVLVASFMVFGTVIVRDIVIRTITDNFSGVSEAVSFVVDLGGEGTKDNVDAVREVPGVAEAVGVMSSGFPVRGEFLSTVSDPGSGPLSRVRLVEGTYPQRTGELALTRRAAERTGLSIGSRTTADPGGRQQADQVEDHRHRRGRRREGPPEGVRPGRGCGVAVRRAVVQRDPGPGRARRRAGDGGGRPVVSRAGRLDRAGRGVSSQGSQGCLLVHGRALRRHRHVRAVAVAAAALVATSTFRIVFAQRMRQLALLRTIGASRRQLTRALAVEGALTGLVAGTIGVVAAAGAGLAGPAGMRDSR
jgi:putative ABC transport system permease protein